VAGIQKETDLLAEYRTEDGNCLSRGRAPFVVGQFSEQKRGHLGSAAIA
jgi:hypothetical protein